MCVQKKELDEIGARLEHTEYRSLRLLVLQETDNSKSSAGIGTKLLKLRLYKATM